MLLTRKNPQAKIVGNLKTFFSDKFPEDMNLAIRVVNKPSGEDIEIYINPRKKYSTLKHRKQIIGSLNKSMENFLKSLMDIIILKDEKIAYKNLIGVKKEDIVSLAQEIKTKSKLLKKDLEFGNEEKIAKAYKKLEDSMFKIEEIVEEIISIKEVEENGRK